MKKKLKISTIVPNLNNGHFLDQNLRSIINQNYSNLEIIVIDGGSTDNSIDIIKKYEDKLHYWISEPDSGQSEAINKGLKVATGDIINWLNSDDYLEDGALTQIADIFQKTNANVVCGRSNIVQDNKILKNTNGTDIYINNLAKTIGWARIDQPETYFRGHVLKSIKPLNKNLHFNMDKDLWIRYLTKFGLESVIKTEDIFVNFRLHANSKTVSQSSSFNQERNSYYYQLALLLPEKKYALFLENNYSINKNLEVTIDIKNTLLFAVLNYFFVLLFNEAYAARDFSLAKKVLSKIDLNNLEGIERNEVLKLASRINLFHKWVFKIRDAI